MTTSLVNETIRWFSTLTSCIMTHSKISLATCILLVGLWSSISPTQADEAAAKQFHEQVAPVLVKNCIECHNSNTRKGNLSLETLADALKGGDEGAAIVPGKPEDSPLFQKVVVDPATKKAEMPQKKPALSDADQALLQQWIAAGATWPQNLVLKEKSKADASFWSFRPIEAVAPPTTPGVPATWQQNPIDRFVIASLSQKGLVPNPPALPPQLIRRISYDLIGLPPSPQEIADFEQAYRSNPKQAVEQLVDRLLASPRYGEQWGRHWLDVIRFGESRGYERNEIITNLWPLRDYVIEAYNQDKPMNQLIVEHLAGDVLANGDTKLDIASAFLVAGPYDDVGNQDPAAAAQIRSDQMDEMVRATGEGFLGLTLGCARCHDHKFDPLKTSDYYAMAATFSGVVHGDREVASPEQIQARTAALAPLLEQQKGPQAQKAALEAKKSADPKTPLSAEEESQLKKANEELAAINAKIAQVPALPRWWVGNHRPAPGPFHVFLGGSPQKLGPEVQPGGLSVFDGVIENYHLEPTAAEGARRLALAKWITRDDQPLTRRVLANRVWHYHFGTGIVDTPSDFGYMGGRPTHPELLDYLASELSKGGWQLKPLHRMIILSQTYQQSSTFRAEAARIDGDSRLLWRFPPRRLTSEEVRDTLLSVAGKLDLRMGGPGFRLYEYQQDNVATYVPLNAHGPDTYRRSVYHHNARAARVDLLTDFDGPDPAFAEPRRAATTTPLQALTLLNHPFSLDMANFFAERVKAESNAALPASQVERAFVLAFGRAPTADELQSGLDLVKEHGLPLLCRTLLNSNELIMID